MARTQLLLMGNIDEKIGIACIEVVEGNPLEVFHRFSESGIDCRALEGRMTK